MTSQRTAELRLAGAAAGAMAVPAGGPEVERAPAAPDVLGLDDAAGVDEAAEGVDAAGVAPSGPAPRSESGDACMIGSRRFYRLATRG
jgi:hypothetical protein